MKKTIIAASLTALAMGSVFAANTYKYNQAQGEPIKYNKDSATEGGKLTGGWYYDHAENVNANTNFDHSANSTDITLTGGTFDELIGAITSNNQPIQRAQKSQSAIPKSL